MIRIRSTPMGRPTDRVIDPGTRSASKWARDAASAERFNMARPPHVSKRDEDFAFQGTTAEASLSDDTSAFKRSPAPRSLDPFLLPPPPSRSLVRFRFAVAGGLAISAAAAAIAALFVLGNLPSWSIVAKDSSQEAASFNSRFAMNIAARPTNKEALLGEALHRTTAYYVATSRTVVASPSGPVNQETLLGEALRGATADDVSSTTTEVASLASRVLDPSEIAVLLKRGQELMTSGDIAAARVILLRAAEARDAKAALALAATFDPVMLKKIGVYGAVGDISTARIWYEKAKEFGSDEAPRRLEILAGREM
jgi:hypothetical protein